MKIGILILDRLSKNKIHKEHYDGTTHLGSWIIEDVLRDKYSDIVIEHCSFATINNYDIVLYSITSTESIYLLVSNMLYCGVKAKSITPLIVVGGAGVLNIRTYLSYADIFVFGRGEDVICDIIDQYNKHGKNKDQYEPNQYFHVSGLELTPKKIKQSDSLYHKELNGYKENMLGCRNFCYFCEYTFSRKYIQSTGSFNLDSKEEDFDHANLLDSYSTTGIDGYSERIRFAVNKKISNQDIINKYLQAESSDDFQDSWRILKMFMISGYPTETEYDYEDFYLLLSKLKDIPKKHKFGLCILNTPFSPEPLTPMMYECANIDINYRDVFVNSKLRAFYHDTFRPLFAYGIISNYTMFRRLVINRGTEEDACLVEFLSHNKRFENMQVAKKINYIKKNVINISKFVKQYAIGEPIASDYLESYIKRDLILKLANKCRDSLYSSADGVYVESNSQ